MELKFLQIQETLGEAVQSPDKVATIMTEEAKADRECFWVIHLNSANKIIEKELVSMGTINNSLVHPREVFKRAILNGATGIITVHNHPGGQAQPSKEDRETWKRLEKGGKLLGIEVMDHLIITPSEEYYSEKEGGLLRKNVKED